MNNKNLFHFNFQSLDYIETKLNIYGLIITDQKIIAIVLILIIEVFKF